MENLTNSFGKESSKQKIILVCAAIIFISTFLPWFSFSFGSIEGFGNLGGFSSNGWHRFGILTGLSSLAMILNWLLPKLNIKIGLTVKEDLLQKILVGAMLGGVVLWVLDASFEFSVMGFGFYIALIAALVAAYSTFLQKRV